MFFVWGLTTSAAAQPPQPPPQSGWRTDFTRLAVDLAEIKPGGPPKDGIPALDHPQFETPEGARWLGPREPVLVVSSGARTKIYPLQILIWHEIVNDVVGASPVTVTYCPLCNTALVFDRRLAGRLLDFATTGWLRHSDLVMYDRQTETWWQQATGEAMVGELVGTRLTLVAAQLLSWAEAARLHPEAAVLSRETGFDRPYGRNPYQRYDNAAASPFAALLSKAPDERLPAMERVVTFETGGESVAYPWSRLVRERVVHDESGPEPVVVFWAPGTASAVDSVAFGQGRDVGATGVFDPRLDGVPLRFAPGPDGRFRDSATGSVWNLEGRAETGPHAGRALQPIPHGNHFWFAWAAFRPETRLRR